jgi:hypothetical protein
MDLINQWLDPSEIRHLAEKLLTPLAIASDNRHQAETEEVAETPPPQDDRLLERLGILCDWAQQTFPIKEIYLLNAVAEVVFGKTIQQVAFDNAREFILYTAPMEIQNHEISSKLTLQIYPGVSLGNSIYLCVLLTQPLSQVQTEILSGLFLQSIS